MKTKIILADDHQIIRDGLKSLIDKETVFELLAEASNGRTTVQLAEEMKPDVVIMDISMPGLNGMEAARQILHTNPDIKIIALSVHSEKQFVSGMLRAGASAYLLKDCAFRELKEAINLVKQNQIYLSPKITGLIIHDYKEKLIKEDQSVFNVLTGREREVLQLLAEGKTTKQVAGELYISVKTVETHRQNIMNKLSVYNLPELVKYAIRQGIVSL
ncbi:MAG: response regulator transcription factor [bacterium]